jgi:hypothetical protein
MRNMSFSMTTEQIRNRTKTITRRIGWKFLQPGQLIQAVEKGMGLKKGEKIKQLAILRVVSVRREPLMQIDFDHTYGVEECRKEGFGDHPQLKIPALFSRWFSKTHGGDANPEITRIEFEYVDSPEMRGPE